MSSVDIANANGWSTSKACRILRKKYPETRVAKLLAGEHVRNVRIFKVKP